MDRSARISTPRESVGIGDVEAQAEKAMSNIAMLLDEAGSSMHDIVKVTVYLTDIRYRETVYRVMGRWLKGVFPVSTGWSSRHSRAPSGWWRSTPPR